MIATLEPETAVPDRGTWRRGRVIAVFSALTALLLLAHSLVPNWVGNAGSLLETFLPWTGLLVLPLLVAALVRRSALALVSLLLPALVWGGFFGGKLVDRTEAGGDLRIVSHNVNDENPDPAGTARALAASGAQVIALEELKKSEVPKYEDALAAGYPHHSVQGTVGVWSTFPLRDTRPVAIMPWTRALRTTVDTPKGPVAVFVAHLPSVRVRLDSGFTANGRDEAIGLLADALAGEPSARTVLVGDFNGTADDRALAPIAARMRSAQDEAGDGFGFSWPAGLPMARIDQVFVAGVRPVASWTLPATGSDHLPVAASLAL
ncbi:endonuclease/exonuclease/phosphatase family protein [Amycolatopsis mongoliensis]|uniref:Endonuclease/exonuclease/phosphatase family protein n=1 Tax=Amycolatopsis mongoliensis TaxID=715475 RepID=A0A9Y2NH87_9PSEU|nr:endonuclease/exonuclease/phosphatase family protein [Amycolatopsis sp. 4-36]WIX99447.1 endonuclease/exonuclease/phosphatase family protein [Amycolatopsis sp. 4-36]